MGERVLITGALGTVGLSLIRHLIEKHPSDAIYATDISPIPPTGFNKIVDVPEETRRLPMYHPLDVTRPNDVAEVFGLVKPSIVFHLAAVYGRLASENSKERAFAVNVNGAYTVARLTAQWDARLIHISSGEVYGGSTQSEMGTPTPDNWYGLSKFMGEQVASYVHPKAVVIRPFMLYHENDPLGEHRSALVRFAEQIARGNEIQVHRDAKRSWFYQDDAVRLINMARHLDEQIIINIGNPETAWSLEQLAQTIAAAQGKIAKIVTSDVPNKITAVKAPALERMQKLLGSPLTPMSVGVPRVARAIQKRVA